MFKLHNYFLPQLWVAITLAIIVGCQPSLISEEVTEREEPTEIAIATSSPTPAIPTSEPSSTSLSSSTPEPQATNTSTSTPPSPTAVPSPTPINIDDLRATVQLDQQEANQVVATPYANGLLTFRQNDQLLVTDPDLANAPTPSEARGPGIWSPDGNFVLIPEHRPETLEAFIHVVDHQGVGQTITIQPYLNRLPTWSPDSQSFAFLAHTGIPWGEYSDNWLTSGFIEELWVATIDEAGQIESLERIADLETPGHGCGGGGYSISDQLFLRQLGDGSNEVSLVWTEQNILVYRLSCGITPGYGRFDMNTLEPFPYHPEKARSLNLDPLQERWVSIDGFKLFGEDSANRLITGSIGTTDIVTLETSAPVHTINVGTMSGRIYYTSRQPIGNEEITMPLPPEWSSLFHFYHTQLWVMDADGANEQLLWESDVHSISRLIETPAGDILFVVVENDVALFEAITGDTPQNEWDRFAPQTYIMRLAQTGVAPEIWLTNADRLSLWLP